MQVSRASPFPQHLLSSRRNGCDRALDGPVIPASRTSHQVAWQEPQKSTESTGPNLAELKIVPDESGFLVCLAASIAATCLAPGPWQASQLTPRIRFFSSN